MSGTQYARREFHRRLKDHGAELLWRADGLFGVLEQWAFRGRLYILQTLPSDAGVRWYGDTPNATGEIDALIETVLREPQSVQGDL